MTSQNSGTPRETSVFDVRSMDDIYSEVRDVYLHYSQPLVIGYSGGKDSTATLQIVWKAIESLPPSERQKTVYVVSSDTKVETPVIVDYIDSTLDRIKATAQSKGMPFEVQKVMPTLNDSFWVNLIGRGYPAPTTRFRWCTDRLKINPVNRFIQAKVTEHGEVIMVLGTRKSESATRMQLMSTYQVKGHLLRRHSTLPGAYVYAPIADFSTDDVWTYLLQVPSPWGNNNRDLAALYRSASAGECPLVIDTTTPSCGNSRFGCWVCTVAQKDTSMEAMIDHGEEWMAPLLEFREWLSSTTDPDKKRDFRDIRGRDGRVVLKRDGTPAARTYKIDISRQMLKKVLTAQKQIRRTGPDSFMTLISNEELHQIRHIWRTEREDWEDSVPLVFHEVNGFDLDWLQDDDLPLDASHKILLSNICDEYGVPFSMIAKMLEVERKRDIATKRSGVQKELDTILRQEWRSEDEIVSEHQQLILLEQ